MATQLHEARSVVQTPSLAARIVTQFEHLDDLSNDWSRLWNATPRREFFDSLSWVRAFWHAYGGNRELCVAVVERGDQVAGILPLAVQDNVARFVTAPRADYNDILCDEDDGSDVLRLALNSVFDGPFRLKGCVLGNVNDQSRLFRLVEDLRQSQRFHVDVEKASTCLHILFDSADGNVQKSILKKRDVKAREKKLLSAGTVRYRHLKTPDEMRACLESFFEQHIVRRTLEGDRSQFLDPEGPRLFFSLLDDPETRDAIHFSVLELDDRPIAFHWGFEVDGRFMYYKPTFDIDSTEYSPGQVLLKRLFEYAVENELNEFDFTVGDFEYKRRFANHESANYNIRIYPKTPGGSLWRGRTRLRNHVNNHPVLFKRLKSAGQAARTLPQRTQAAIRRHGIVHVAARASTAPLRLAMSRLSLYQSTEMLFFSSQGHPASDDLSSAGGQLEEARMASIALLAAGHRRFFTDGKLTKIQQRLKDGDRAWMLMRNGECAHLAWYSVREELSDPALPHPDCRIPVQDPVAVIYDCWTPPDQRGNGAYPEILRLLMQRAADEGLECWISCRAANHASRRGIEKAGFELQHRVRSTRMLRWFRHNSVTSAGNSVD